MAQLPPRQLSDTPASHLGDHNEIHDQLNDLDPDAASDGDILKMSTGAWSADTPANHAISEVGHPHGSSDLTDWTSASITESQISDLSHFVEQEVTYIGNGTYNVLVTDRVVIAKTDSGSATVILPDTTTFGAYAIMVKCKGGNPVTIQRTVPDQFWTDGNLTNTRTLQDPGAQWIGASDPTDDQWNTLGERGNVT